MLFADYPHRLSLTLLCALSLVACSSRVVKPVEPPSPPASTPTPASAPADAPVSEVDPGASQPAASATKSGAPRLGIGSSLPAPDGPMKLTPVAFSEIPGWAQDDWTSVWPALDRNCLALRGKAPWSRICALAQRLDRRDGNALRALFEQQFIAQRLSSQDGQEQGLITGYYEPLLRGSRNRKGAFQHPILKLPNDLIQVDLGAAVPEVKNLRLRGRLVGNKVVPYPTRAELDAAGLFAQANAALFWVDDAVEAFFLGVQGSGRIRLDDGSTVRVGYADQNGHSYRSIGRWLIDQGELRPDQATLQGIKAWASANPQRVRSLLNVNPSVIFFKEMPPSPPDEGPVGALNVPLTPGRSIAVDPRFLQLGTAVFLLSPASAGVPAQQRLVFAQDTGSAIKGTVRADWFAGFGEQAGEIAGRMKQPGRMIVLTPREFGPNSK